MLTSHGHQIPNTTVQDEGILIHRARCGGVSFCDICKQEAAPYETVPEVSLEMPELTPRHNSPEQLELAIIELQADVADQALLISSLQETVKSIQAALER